MTTSRRTDIAVTRDADQRRYRTSAGGAGIAGFIEYQETSELVVLTHTEVDPAFRGLGVGSALARAALDDIRDRRLKALVLCPFIIRWLRRHHDYVDILVNAPLPKSGTRRRHDHPVAGRAGWIGAAGPGPSYLDPGSGGPENDFTNRNTTFMTYNLMHLAAMLRAAGGVPAYGNRRSQWDAGCAPDQDNPEHR
jgi:predicted GNAT family acetyltransferase